MSRLNWDALGEHEFETGVDRGVCYPWDNTIGTSGNYGKGEVWNGLTAVNESPEGAEANDLYADNIKYLSLLSAENYKFSIEAYTFPKKFKECDGTAEIKSGVYIGQQARKVFGFSYRTLEGNDTEDTAHGYKIHIAYGCKASPSEKSHSTTNDSPEAVTFSWECSTTPVNVTGYKPTATCEIDSLGLSAASLKEIEAYLYGVDDFSETATYAIGDFVKHETKVYVASSAVTTPGEWDSSNWTEKTGITGDPTLLLPDEIKAIAEAPSQG